MCSSADAISVWYIIHIFEIMYVACCSAIIRIKFVFWKWWGTPLKRLRLNHLPYPQPMVIIDYFIELFQINNELKLQSGPFESLTSTDITCIWKPFFFHAMSWWTMFGCRALHEGRLSMMLDVKTSGAGKYVDGYSQWVGTNWVLDTFGLTSGSQAYKSRFHRINIYLLKSS